MNRIRALVFMNVGATFTGLVLAGTNALDPYVRAALIFTAVAMAATTFFLLIRKTKLRVNDLQKEVEDLGLANKRLSSNLGDKSHENAYLVNASARFEDLFHGVPFGCFTVDDLGTIYEWNSASSVLFDVPSHVAIQKTVFEGLFDTRGSDMLANALKDALLGQPSFSLELCTASIEGRKHVLVNVFGIGGDAPYAAAMIACADITRLKAAEETILKQNSLLNEAMLKVNENSVKLEIQQIELEDMNAVLNRLATTDGLTGLLNHRTMQFELAAAVERSKSSSSRIGFVLFDVDHFKRFNDDFGHQIGDEVLKKISTILQESVRDTDIVARYGGEEFCAILPSTDPYDCKLICENIRQNVESAVWSHRKVTISVGFAVGNGASAPSDLIRSADQALYQAKGAGRNRVCMYEPPRDQCA